MKLALIGYGNVGQALDRLMEKKRAEFPFEITGMHTARRLPRQTVSGMA